jgi:hypothetical protein
MNRYIRKTNLYLNQKIIHKSHFIKGLKGAKPLYEFISPFPFVRGRGIKGDRVNINQKGMGL